MEPKVATEPEKDTAPRSQWQKPQIKRLKAGAAEEGFGSTNADGIRIS